MPVKIKLQAVFVFVVMIFSSVNTCQAVQKKFVEKTSNLLINSVEERRLLVSLRQMRENLIKQEQTIEIKKEELKSLAQEVDNKLNELTRQREEIEKLLDRKEAEQSVKAQRLGKMYEKMDPVKAATVMIELDERLATAILNNMKKKAAAKLLNNMERGKAVKLTEALSSF